MLAVGVGALVKSHSPNLIDEIRSELRADKVRAAIRNQDTGPVFDWLMAALSYQGISDQVAYEYMEKHGRATWQSIKQALERGASCPKLKRYRRQTRGIARNLRNGRRKEHRGYQRGLPTHHAGSGRAQRRSDPPFPAPP